MNVKDIIKATLLYIEQEHDILFLEGEKTEILDKVSKFIEADLNQKAEGFNFAIPKGSLKITASHKIQISPPSKPAPENVMINDFGKITPKSEYGK